MTYTPGNVHDSKEFDKLLGINKHKHKNKIKTYGEVYADSAYANKKNDVPSQNRVRLYYALTSALWDLLVVSYDNASYNYIPTVEGPSWS
jgi:predicted nucleic acid-binding protein